MGGKISPKTEFNPHLQLGLGDSAPFRLDKNQKEEISYFT